MISPIFRFLWDRAVPDGLLSKYVPGKLSYRPNSPMSVTLDALRDGVFGQLTRKDEADSGLDLPGRNGGPLVVAGQAGGLTGKALEHIVDEHVHR